MGNRAPRRIDDAARAKELDGVLAIYAEDAVYEVRSSAGVPGSGEHRGIEAIAAMERRGLEASDVQPGVVHTTHSFRALPESAFELGTVSGPVRARGGGEAEVVTFHFMAIWEPSDDGVWKIRHLVGRM